MKLTIVWGYVVLRHIPLINSRLCSWKKLFSIHASVCFNLFSCSVTSLQLKQGEFGHKQRSLTCRAAELGLHYLWSSTWCSHSGHSYINTCTDVWPSRELWMCKLWAKVHVHVPPHVGIQWHVFLPKSEESAEAGYHYAPTVLFVPNCILSPCGEQTHEQNTQRIVLVCVLCVTFLLFL